MAVRNDFTAGEVLAAADLNDTFGAKANLASPTFTGTPAAPTAAAGTNTTQLATTAFVQSAGGLVLVSPTSIANSGGSASASGGEVTFTGVSSVSLNGVFTSAYTNYIITGYLVGSETSGFGWRLRSGGTDNSTASSYKTETVYSLSAAAGGVNYNLSFWSTVGTTSSTVDTPYSMQVLSPNVERQTSMLLTHAGRGSRIALCGGHHTATTAFDGITLLPDTGTISGNIRVYGYKNS